MPKTMFKIVFQQDRNSTVHLYPNNREYEKALAFHRLMYDQISSKDGIRVWLKTWIWKKEEWRPVINLHSGSDQAGSK